MATIIDELVVVLGLDASQFTDAQKEALNDFQRTRDEAEKTGKQLEQQGKRAAEFYSQIKREALGLFAIVVGQGSLDSYIRTQTDALVGMGVAAKNAGVAVKELSAWQNVTRANGDNSGASQATLVTLANTIEKWKTGRGLPGADFMNYFSQIGGQTSDDPVSIIRKLAAAGERNHWSPEFIAQAGRGLGLDPYSIYEAQKGTKQFDKDYATQLGNAPDDATVRAAQDLKASFVGLSAAIVHDINADFIPLDKAIGPVIRGFTGIITKFPILTGVVAGVIAIFTTLGTAMTGLRAIIWGLTGGGAAGGGSAAAGAAGVAAGGAGLAGVEATGGIGLIALPALLSLDSGALQYQSAMKNPGASSDDDLGQAMAYLSYRLKTTPAGAVGDGLKKKFAADLAKLQAEAARRHGAPAPASGAVTASGGGGSSDPYVAGLMRRGIDATHASAIARGIHAEGGTPTAFNSAGGGQGAFGIGQWRGARLKALRDKYGPNPSLDQQLDFLVGELRGGDKGGPSVLAAQGQNAALIAYINNFMRPGAGARGDFRRAGLGGGEGGQTINIGKVEVVTNATDAKGVAKDLRHALTQGNLANRGLS